MGYGRPRISLLAWIILLFVSVIVFIPSLRPGFISNFGSNYHKDDGIGRHAHQSTLIPVDESKGYNPIRNETLGFQRIYCINLEDRSDKRDAMALVSSATGIQLEFSKAIRGASIAEKALPRNWDRKAYSDEALGCLRSHMNVLRDIIEKRLSSALIIEDDTSWDVSIKRQLIAFAKASRYITDSSSSAIPHSPFGDKWDLLWLGHCGSKPHEGNNKAFVMEEGAAVPAPHRRVKYGDSPDMGGYSKHTRVVYNAAGGTCTYAYAVSFRGAQKILNYLSSAKGPVDWELGEMCGETDLRCVAPFPPLISEYKAAGSKTKDSDIENIPAEVRQRGFAYNLVFDARLNFDKLLNRQTDYESQWPEDLPQP